jgi:hypothetical protein
MALKPEAGIILTLNGERITKKSNIFVVLFKVKALYAGAGFITRGVSCTPSTF